MRHNGQPCPPAYRRGGATAKKAQNNHRDDLATGRLILPDIPQHHYPRLTRPALKDIIHGSSTKTLARHARPLRPLTENRIPRPRNPVPRNHRPVQRRFPLRIRRLFILLLLADADPRIIRACGLPIPPKIFKILAGLIMRRTSKKDPVPDNAPNHVEALAAAVYPNGYEMNELGTHIQAKAAPLT